MSLKALAGEVGELDHLVTLAAAPANGPIATLTRDAVMRAFDAKVIGPMLLAKHFAPRFRDGAAIVLFSGVAAWRPMPGRAVMATTNGAVAFLAEALAVDLAPVRVTAVSPGIVDSGAWDRLGPDKDEFFRRTAERNPARRAGTPADLAAATRHVLANPFVTGTTLHVDGGGRLARNRILYTTSGHSYDLTDRSAAARSGRPRLEGLMARRAPRREQVGVAELLVRSDNWENALVPTEPRHRRKRQVLRSLARVRVLSVVAGALALTGGVAAAVSQPLERAAGAVWPPVGLEPPPVPQIPVDVVVPPSSPESVAPPPRVGRIVQVAVTRTPNSGKTPAKHAAPVRHDIPDVPVWSHGHAAKPDRHASRAAAAAHRDGGRHHQHHHDGHGGRHRR